VFLADGAQHGGDAGLQLQRSPVPDKLYSEIDPRDAGCDLARRSALRGFRRSCGRFEDGRTERNASRNTNLYRAKALERSPRRTIWTAGAGGAPARLDAGAGSTGAVLFALGCSGPWRSVPTVVAGAGAAEAAARGARASPERRSAAVLTVRAGDAVEKGQIIGKLDQSGDSQAHRKRPRDCSTCWGAGSRQDRLRQQRLQLQMQQDAASGVRCGAALDAGALTGQRASRWSSRCRNIAGAVHEMVKARAAGRAAHEVSDAEFAYRDNDIRIANTSRDYRRSTDS